MYQDLSYLVNSDQETAKIIAILKGFQKTVETRADLQRLMEMAVNDAWKNIRVKYSSNQGETKDDIERAILQFCIQF